MTSWALAALLSIPPALSQAQAPAAPPLESAQKRIEVGGEITILADALPRMDVVELRPQALLEATVRIGGLWRARFEGFAEGLVADRNGLVTDGGVRVREAWIEAAGARGELRVGYGRLVWGRLDEIQPSDVINPIDAARFVFESRSAARLPVAFVRGRVFVSDSVVAEGVFAPIFRRGTFDELDEATSPFNLTNDLILPANAIAGVERIEPPMTWANVNGGGRVSSTIGRVDVTVGAYRGTEGQGPLVFELSPSAGPAVVGRLVERFPRFTMVAGDFETVAGQWALRGEVAMFVDRTFQGRRVAGPVRGKALDAGLGFDRAAGEWRMFGSLLLHRRWSDADPGVDRTDVTVIGSVERRFGRDRYLVRVFGAATPGDRSGFLRGLFAWTLRDNVTLDLSAAAFAGEGETLLGLFHRRDFVLSRLRYHW